MPEKITKKKIILATALPREAILEYKEIFKKMYKKDLSFDEAEKQANELYRIMQIVYKPIKKEWMQNNTDIDICKNPD